MPCGGGAAAVEQQAPKLVQRSEHRMVDPWTKTTIGTTMKYFVEIDGKTVSLQRSEDGSSWTCAVNDQAPLSSTIKLL